MKPELQRAIQGLLRLGEQQQSAVNDGDLVPFEDEDLTFGCEVRDSDGLRWVLAPDAKAADNWLAMHEGDPVFTRAEIKAVTYGIHAMSADERKEWLADMIAIKSVIPTATACSITFRDSVIQRRRK